MKSHSPVYQQQKILPRLPGIIVSEINTLVNQNQKYIELLALRHCEIQRRFDTTRGPDRKILHFYRRRDLRFMFECGDKMLEHYMMRDYQYLLPALADHRMSLSVKKYIRDLLESFVEYLSSYQGMSYESRSTAFKSLCSVDDMSVATSSSSRSSSSRERDVVYNSNGSIEVQREVFAPSVTFSDSVEFFEF